jgi:hypothetical protein
LDRRAQRAADGIAGSLQVIAAAVAARTTRIHLGAAVTRVRLHHPLLTAEGLAMVDVISAGYWNARRRGLLSQWSEPGLCFAHWLSYSEN